LFVIPANAGIQGTSPLFFYFFRIPADERGMENGSVAILLGSGFRQTLRHWPGLTPK